MHAGGLRVGTALVLKYVRDEVVFPTGLLTLATMPCAFVLLNVMV